MVTDWPLTGRQSLVAQCGELLNQPGSDGFVLVGAAGVGKSRLLDECARRAEDAGFAVGRVHAHHAGRAIPFGALAPLLPPGREMVASGVPLLNHARAGLAAFADARPLVLAVDDAHLLDDASAVLIYQLAVTQFAFVMASVRTGDAVPDAVSALWRDGRAERIDVDALAYELVAELLAGVLGGTVETATTDALFAASGGNALYLRELVRASLDHGRLNADDGVWRLIGRVGTSTRLHELVAAALADVDDDAHAVLELLAIGEPLGLDGFAHLAAGVLESLERRGFVAITASRRRTLVSCAHPLHAEVLRAAMPADRARALCGAVAAAIERTGARRRGDVMRLATFALDGGETPPADMLAAAAHQAFFANDLPLAERLVRAAEAAESRFETRQLLRQILYRDGRGSEMAVHEEEHGTESERALDCINRASMLFWQLGQRDEANLVVNETIARLPAGAWWDEIVAMQATFDVNAGEPALALERVAPITAAAGRPYVQASLVATLALPHLGRAADAVELVAPARAAYLAMGDLVSMFQVSLLTSTHASALLEVGQLTEASAAATAGYDEATRLRDPSGRAFCALVLGRIARWQGRPVTAAQWSSEAAALFRAMGHVGPMRWALGGVALAKATGGDAEGSRAALAEHDDAPEHPAVMLESDTERARAWLAVSNGDLATAHRLLTNTAATCRARGLLALEAQTLHDLVRLDGGHVADRIDELARHSQGDLLAALASDARAIAAGAPELLAASAEALAALGANLLAAETAARAAVAFDRTGRQRDATAWNRRAAVLHQQCEGARTPALARRAGPVPLTTRERQIAVLAASGMASKTIAAQLFLSARTVDNNLARVYGKLGVSDRSALAQALALEPGAIEPGAMEEDVE